MKNADAILAMRVRGIRPSPVWFTDIPASRGALDVQTEVMPLTVQYERTDNPSTADVRFVVGLDVRVEGGDEDVVMAWSQAFIKAKASSVMWTVTKRIGSGEFAKEEVVCMGDTNGMNWRND